MIILGVDPGTIMMGYGLLRIKDEKTSLIECGVLSPKARSPIGERLFFLYTELGRIIAEYHPEVMAVEQPFFAKNARSALAIGRAQAVAILAAASQNIPFYEYTPTQVKMRVANYGASSKEQIQEMVRLQLGLDAVPEPNDAADALAVALCHLGELRFNSLLANQR